MKTVVFPGSFDPITEGHADIIKRAARLFDKVIVAVCDNCEKSYLFSEEKRLSAVRAAIKDIPNASAELCNILLADFARMHGASVLLKGVRNAADFDYEAYLFNINRSIGDLETVILVSAPEVSFISSTMVRELIKYGKDFSAYVPAAAMEFLK